MARPQEQARTVEAVTARIRALNSAQQALYFKLIARLEVKAGMPKFTKYEREMVIVESYNIASEARTPAQIAEAEAWFLQQHHLRCRQSYSVPTTFDVED